MRSRLVMVLAAARSDLFRLQKHWERYGPVQRPEDDARQVREAFQVVDVAVHDLIKIREALSLRYRELLVQQQTEGASK